MVLERKNVSELMLRISGGHTTIHKRLPAIYREKYLITLEGMRPLTHILNILGLPVRADDCRPDNLPWDAGLILRT